MTGADRSGEIAAFLAGTPFESSEHVYPAVARRWPDGSRDELAPGFSLARQHIYAGDEDELERFRRLDQLEEAQGV
ncbi:hypothetical protein SAMN05216548_12718 [Faunimonas pinastri]|uniref:Uncharacterized protein n=1 Tax=Faunimonas pinastri TaxID=1855383 RepID=A0A1H9QFC0_9HYPH|nr:hypothetical protein [Faunimonas pinastri]SER58559.1 hypothetical protein SAMN05216548_12718 [Faunimonas pinastri]